MYNVGTTSHDAGKDRTATMRKWMQRALELKDAEADAKMLMPTHCAKILSKKNLSLFAEMLHEAGYKDTTLVQHMRSGFDLMGRLPSSGVFPKKFTHATMTPDQVRSAAKSTRKAIWHSTRASHDKAIDAEVYNATSDEKSRGFLEGPLDISELPDDASLTRRFGVLQTSPDGQGGQKSKVRPIDNFTESLINLTNSSSESIPVHSVDLVVAGIVYRLTLNHLVGTNEDLGIKTIDLRKAYKQVPLSTEALKDGHLCVFNPTTGQPEAFRSVVLPFGSRSSVQAFYRASHSLWTLGTVLLRMHWTLFYDDFILIGRGNESKHLTLVVSSFFSMLGWETSQEKEGRFEHCAKALGVMVDLSESALFRVTVRNTESRRAELMQTLGNMLAKGSFKQGELLTLRGRLHFAEGELFGRTSSAHLQVVSMHAESGHGGRITADLREALIFLKDRLDRAIPRCLTGKPKGLVHIYTDACFDASLAGLGGVMVDEMGVCVKLFSLKVSDDEKCAISLASENETIILELEALALLLGIKSFCGCESEDEIVCFGDNEGVIRSFISMRSENRFVKGALDLFAQWEEGGLPFVWLERVASASNLSDGPSRLNLAGLEGVPRVDVEAGPLIQEIVSLIKDNHEEKA